MNDSKPKIRIQNLIKIFGDRPRTALDQLRQGKTRDQIQAETGNVVAVSDVSFDIARGELFVIMGLSGSGKSTLIRCINSLIPATSGHVFIDDDDIAHVDEARLREIRQTKITMVFQKFALFPHRTVSENVEYGLKVRGVPKQERREKALVTLGQVGLAQWADYKPSALSGGMQQRVGLARALATDAEILLMDEAFSALDPLIRREMQDELLRLQEELQKTIVFISHDIQEALKIGDRVAILKDGALVQVGTPEDIVTKPANDYIAAFTQDVNRAQVLKTGSIVRRIPPYMLSQGSLADGSLEMALEHLHRYDCNPLYVVDQQKHPVGYVTDEQLNNAVKAGDQDIQQVMQTEFPVVPQSSCLEEALPLCDANIPLAVVCEEGEFQGVIEQSDIVSHLVA
ncbi:MAG: glycine betaine/L-proline ABC transporter ATP-binding protein [Cyanobacteria bacterium P01_F01_bin.150]